MQSLKAKATRLPEYKLLLKRRYQNPEGYLKFEEVAMRVAAALEVSLNMPQSRWDWTQSTLTPIAAELARSQAPVYWVTESLLRALLETDLPEDVAVSQLQMIVQGAFFMLPKGMILTPDGESLDFFGVRQIKQGCPLPPIQVGGIGLVLTEEGGAPMGTHSNTAIWFTQAESGYMYAGNLSVTEREIIKGKTHLPDNYDGDRIDKEQIFLQEVTHNLLLKLLLCMQMRPNLIEGGQFLQSGRKPGVKLGKAKRFDELWSPNWIGKNYQAPSSRELGGTHASPRMHWRRGHMRRVPVGKRELGDRKWVWIEPVLVNASEVGG
jgi:hypothetical protein